MGSSTHGPLSAGSALQVELGSGARLEPFAMAKAGTTLAAGASIASQSTEAVNAAAAKKRGARPAPVLAALGTQLHSRSLTASETLYLQVRAWQQSLTSRGSDWELCKEYNLFGPVRLGC